MLILSSEMEVKHCRRMLRFNTEQLWQILISQG
jgi:hypothetical protein